MPKLRILVADDHAVVREGLKRLIEAESDMEVVGEAKDGADAIKQALLLRPQVIVMDISMPKVGGLQATRDLKTLCPATKVVALTVHEDRSYLRELFDAGALGYILKRTAADELVRALRTVAKGGVYVDPHVAGKLVRPASSKQEEGTSSVQISERESDVLRNSALGYSNKEIGVKLRISVKTVETYKARAMEKLGLKSRVDIVRLATDRGWFEQG